jgi:acetyltransferase-like isoleucine patch superfamily enzyme
MEGGEYLPHDWFGEPLPPNVVVGQESWVYSSFAFLHYHSERRTGVRIGDHSGIYNGTFFELGKLGQVDIGDYCAIVGAIIVTNGTVSIGDYAFIAHEVVIADVPVAAPPTFAIARGGGGPKLGRDVWVGMGAVILGPITVGDGAVIAARSVVTDDVPAHSVVAGHPARVVRTQTPE